MLGPYTLHAPGVSELISVKVACAGIWQQPDNMQPGLHQQEVAPDMIEPVQGVESSPTVRYQRECLTLRRNYRCFAFAGRSDFPGWMAFSKGLGRRDDWTSGT